MYHCPACGEDYSTKFLIPGVPKGGEAVCNKAACQAAWQQARLEMQLSR